MSQASNALTGPKEGDRTSDPVAEIFAERALAARMKGPAGWLWRAEWVEEGLAARKGEEDQDDTPAILKGWRKR
jgi:hypothetical protein